MLIILMWRLRSRRCNRCCIPFILLSFVMSTTCSHVDTLHGDFKNSSLYFLQYYKVRCTRYVRTGHALHSVENVRWA